MHGEAGSVDMVSVTTQLEILYEKLRPYASKDIFNGDESALFWKAIPDKALATTQMAGGKAVKARITAHFCCNATGTDKLPIWFIGMAAKPRCLAANGIAMEDLDIVWRHNKKGWMNAEIFVEWLFWLDARMAGRKIALLIDSFSAHERGLEIVRAEGGLENVEVIFLPVNATSVCQPLDQGIIRSWKAHYRRRWVHYMVDEHSNDRDPNKTMHVLQALRWGISSWAEDVSPTTIANCWLQARVLGPDFRPLTEAQAKALEKSHNQVVSQVSTHKFFYILLMLTE
jgi:hypothetical protein